MQDLMTKASGYESEFWNGDFFHFLLVEFGIFCEPFERMRNSFQNLTWNTEFSVVRANAVYAEFFQGQKNFPAHILSNHHSECGFFKLKNFSSSPQRAGKNASGASCSKVGQLLTLG